MANFAPVSAMSVVTGSGKLAPVMAIPVVVISDGSVPVGPGTAQAVIDVTANAAYPRAPVQPIPIVYATGTPPVAPFDPLPIFVVSGSIVVTAAFDSATLTDTALSNGNLTATHTTANANSGARVATAKSTGKYYFEIKMVAGNGSFDGMGLAQLATTYNNFALTSSNQIIAYRSGGISINAVASGKNIGAFVANDVLGLAVDLDARLVWCRRNAGLWNATAGADPVTATGGLAFAGGTSLAPTVCFVGSGTAINDAYTANFGATTYANPAPSGFNNWPGT